MIFITKIQEGNSETYYRFNGQKYTTISDLETVIGMKISDMRNIKDIITKNIYNH